MKWESIVMTPIRNPSSCEMESGSKVINSANILRTREDRKMNDQSDDNIVSKEFEVVHKLTWKGLYNKQLGRDAVRDFVVVNSILVLWIISSVVISMPLLFVPESLTITVKTPYIALWIAVLSHAMLFKKMLSSRYNFVEVFTLKSILLFLILWVIDSAALSGFIWLIQYYEITDGPQYFLLVTMPWTVVFFIHFTGFYIGYKWFLNVEIQESWKKKLMAMFGMQTLILQLTVSLYFGYAFDEVSAYNPIIGALMWTLYPLLIGAVKSIEQKLTAPFEVEEIYEFTSLSLAAMPYRFIFLGVDRLLIAFIIIIIKFSYKTSFDFIVFTPFYLRCRKRCSRKKVNDKSKIGVDNTSKRRTLNTIQVLVSSKGTKDIKTNAKLFKDDVELEKQTIEQSQKFFFQQFLDSWDILAALVIVVILRTLGENIVSDLDDRFFYLFLIESGIELGLEALFTILAPWMVVKWTILEDFSPIKHTKKIFKDNIVYFTISSLLIFPLFIYIISKVPR